MSRFDRFKKLLFGEENIPDNVPSGTRPEFKEVSYADPGRLYAGTGIWAQFNPSELVTRKGMTTIDRMRNDDQIKAALALKKLAALATGWILKSPEGQDQPESIDGTESEWEVTAFVRWALTEGIQNSLEDSLLELLTGLDYGFSVNEKVWAEVTPEVEKEYTGKIYLKSIKGRKPHYFYFESDQYGNLVNIRQLKPDNKSIYDALPPEKFIVFTNEFEWGNFYGKPDVEAVYKQWFVKDHTYKWLGMYLEKCVIPPIFFYFNPENSPKDLISDAQTILKNLQAGTIITAPRRAPGDAEAQVLNMGQNVKDVFVPAFDMLNKDISRGLLMPGLLGLTPSGETGSYARSRVDFDVFLLVVERIRNILAKQIINEQIIKPLVIYNYGPQEDYPCFEWMPLKDEVKKEIFDIWSSMTSQGVVTKQNIDESHIRKVLKFPERQEGDEKLPMPGDPNFIDPNNPNPDGEEPGEDEDIEEEDMEKGNGAKKNPRRMANGKAKPPNRFGGNKRELSQGHVHEFRQKNKYEKQIDFTQIEEKLSGLEGTAKSDLIESLESTRDAIIKRAKKYDNAGEIAKLKSLPGMKSFRESIRDLLDSAYEYGAKNLRQNIPAAVKKFEQRPNYVPRDAINYLKSKSINITSTTEDYILRDVKQTLENRLKLGWTLEETQEALYSVFVKYAGDNDVLKDDEVLQPYRLENIIRTESTSAFNQGRLVMARDPDLVDSIQGMMYSAVLDDRTTEVCRGLDGKIFKLGDPDLDRLAPPNHYQCRSILVPITIGTQVEEDEFVTPSQAGRAIEDAGEGFA